eukprot:5754885-Heterocapsa_arctica.AAC.1
MGLTLGGSGISTRSRCAIPGRHADDARREPARGAGVVRPAAPRHIALSIAHEQFFHDNVNFTLLYKVVHQGPSSQRFEGAFWRSSSSGLMRRSALVYGSAYQVVGRVVDQQVPLG